MGRTKQICEIMTKEVLPVRQDEQTSDVARYLVALGMTGAPVVDSERRPIGYLSLNDVLGCSEDTLVWRAMSYPADVVEEVATTEDAVAILTERNRHHLIVVDQRGEAVGFVSLIDVLRALRGHPLSRMQPFPRTNTALRWCRPIRLDHQAVAAAPAGPGVYLLVRQTPGEQGHVVWSETSTNVRSRLKEILNSSQLTPAQVAEWLEQGGLSVWIARAPSTTKRPHRPSEFLS